MNIISILKSGMAVILLLMGWNVSYAQPPDSSSATDNSVTVDTLTSEPTSTVTATEPENLTAQDDTVITQRINSEISKSAILAKLPVEVVSENGVVTLSGNVDSDSQASSLIEIAQSVIGVKNVDADGLKIKNSSQPFADMLITAKVKGLLIREDVFGTRDIPSINLSVETKDGVVYLTGVIDNKQQIENAKRIISEVSGVKKVEYIVREVQVNE